MKEWPDFLKCDNTEKFVANCKVRFIFDQEVYFVVSVVHLVAVVTKQFFYFLGLEHGSNTGVAVQHICHMQLPHDKRSGQIL